jgi:hypothetical protein
MIQRCGGLRFLFEAADPILVGREFSRQDLEGYFAMESRILGRYTSPIPPSPIFERIS